MHLVERVRASIQLVSIRLQLPHLLASEPLDGLLGRLGTRRGTVTLPLAHLDHALDRGEAWTNRVPLVPRTCLYRTIARYALYRRHGFPAEFVMAISPRGPDEDGHAWLEFNGQPYREERAAEFVESFRYPPRVL